MKRIFSLLLWYLPVFLVQTISSRITLASINPWYTSLVKASWNPPPWVFGPVWTLLYFMMTIAVWMVYHAPTKHQLHRLGYSLFFAQLLANGLWSILFFGLHLPGWALLDLAILLILVTLTATTFYRMRKTAGLLLLPYLAWSLYAFTLNAAIWWLN